MGLSAHWTRVSLQVWQNKSHRVSFARDLALSAQDFEISFFLGFGSGNGGSSNLLFQVSTNLREWTPTFNVFPHLTSFRFVDHSTSPTQPWRFYRASSETEAIIDKLAAWRGLGFSKYTFRQQMVCGCDPAILTGTVTVENGKVVDVTDATAFGDPGVPVPNPDLSRFNSIEELFDLIQSQMRNSDVFAVQFDSSMHFPAQIEINYYVQFVDDEETYSVSDLHAFPTR